MLQCCNTTVTFIIPNLYFSLGDENEAQNSIIYHTFGLLVVVVCNGNIQNAPCER